MKSPRRRSARKREWLARRRRPALASAEIAGEERVSYNLVMGLFCIAVGLGTLAARIFGWKALLSKKEPMERYFGPRAGNVIHFISYTIVPLVIAAIFLNREIDVP